MSLRRQSHANFQEVDDEFSNIDLGKEDKITFGTRAPNSNDKGRFWVNVSGTSGNRFYFRHPTSGTWTLV